MGLIEAVATGAFRIARIARRTPRALSAATAAFIDTLMPVTGKSLNLAAFRLSEDILREALQIFLDDRAVRPRKLFRRFGKATGMNLLSFCEIRGFITKPESKSWVVNFEQIRAYQAEFPGA